MVPRSSVTGRENLRGSSLYEFLMRPELKELREQ